jgi:hypothetical protein
LLVFGVFALLRFGPRRLSQIVAGVLLIFSPLFPILLIQVGWRVAEGHRAARGKASAPYLLSGTKPKQRVLWLVFDEMDQRIAFTERPAGLSLPELDRLRGESLFATNAYPLAGKTVFSMPALITGRLITKTEATGGPDLKLTFQDHRETGNWSAQPNVFSKSRELGHNSGLIGWYHPYCHLMGDALSFCSRDKELSFGLKIKLEPATTKNVLQSIRTQIKNAFTSMFRRAPLVGRGLRFFGFKRSVKNPPDPIFKKPPELKEVIQSHLSEHLKVYEATKNRLTDPRLDLLLVHWPIPHPAGIYSRARGEYHPENTSSYLDNLALVDQILAEIRQDLERAGQWDNTTIIVTSDHWWRVKVWEPKRDWTNEEAAASGGVTDRRVPFIIKLAGQNKALEYEPAFNTVLTHDLIISLLQAELTDPQDIARWLDAHRSVAETPYGRSKGDE